jgi:acyl-CoA thioesterase-1
MKTALMSIVLTSWWALSLSQSAAGPDRRSLEFFRRLEEGTPQVIVLYGTSLTVTGGWVDALNRWFRTEYPRLVTVVNSGGSGQNSTWGVENLTDKVLQHRPDLVLIEFSYNDAHEKFGLRPQDAWNKLDAIVAGIHEHRPGAAVVLQIMNVGWDAPNGNRSLSVRPQLDTFNDEYRRYARQHALPLLDHFPAWSRLKRAEAERFQRYVPDGSHPTKEGSLAMTWPTIRSFLVSLQDAVRTAK